MKERRQGGGKKGGGGKGGGRKGGRMMSRGEREWMEEGGKMKERREMRGDDGREK